MTEWGPPIEANGVRPAWLRDDERVMDVDPGRQSDGMTMRAVDWHWPLMKAIRLPADHPYYRTKKDEGMAIENTLDERKERYGDFAVNAGIAQDMKEAMRADRMRWGGLSRTHQQALDMICDKISRILSGDPNYKDNWHDIQGYAKLAEDACDAK